MRDVNWNERGYTENPTHKKGLLEPLPKETTINRILPYFRFLRYLK